MALWLQMSGRIKVNELQEIRQNHGAYGKYRSQKSLGPSVFMTLVQLFLKPLSFPFLPYSSLATERDLSTVNFTGYF